MTDPAATSIDQARVLDLTVGWLVQNCEASVRLVNCVAATPSISEITLRQFLNDPSAVRQLLMGTRSLGKKTADELIALGCSLVAGPMVSRLPLAQHPEPDARVAFRVLVTLLSAIPFPSALLTIETSARLRNCLNTHLSSGLTGSIREPYPENLGAVLAGWPEFSRKLLKQANSGHKTVHELANIITNIVIRKIGARHGSANPFLQLTIGDLAQDRLSSVVIQTLLEISTEAEDLAVGSGHSDISMLLHGAETDADLSPLEHVRTVVSRLPNKERDVVVRRYGLEGRAPETLEQVAVQFHVTRERVRQVEAKALTRLRMGENRRAFLRLLQVEGESIWNVLSQGSDLLLPVDLQDHRHAIAAECILAVEVVHARLIDWAANMGRPALGGFLRGSIEAEEIRKSARQLADWAADAPGPMLFAAADQVIGVSRADLAIAIKLRSDIRSFEGYICPGHFGSQARRTCRLHNLALEFGDSVPFDIATLSGRYASKYPEDDVSKRVILLQLKRAPHLFFKLVDQLWIAFGSGTSLAWQSAIESLPFDKTPFDAEPEFEAGSIGAWLYAALADGGPTRVVDLRAQAVISLSQEISQSSVGAVLQSNPDFVRLAPGVYGLQRHVGEVFNPSASVCPAMLSDAQCRYYATSRMAEDPINIYPAWNYRLEAALCRWASRNASNENYRSMLAISEPSKWGVGPEEEDIWHNLKRVHGKFRLPRPDPPQTLRLPAAAAFVSAGIYLCLTGSIAWTTANRVAHRRIDDQKAASTLALLVSLGLAAEPTEWHGRYLALPLASVIISNILVDLSSTGRLSWDEGTLHSIRREPAIGSVSAFDVRQLEAILAGGDETAESGRMMEGGRPADLESLFDSDEWSAAFLSESE
jgi:hypothetical protein